MTIRASVPLVLAVAGTLLTSAAVAQSCVIVSIRNCCDALPLNFSRKCGILQGQDCPDQALSNPAYYFSTSMINGNHPGSSAPSVVCEYKTGRCTGNFGNNLCEISDLKTHECVSQPAGAPGCTTASPRPR